MNLAFFTSDISLKRFFVRVGENGCYRVNLSDKTVDFIPGKLEKNFDNGLLVNINIPVKDVLEPLDSPYNSSGKAMHYEWGRVSGKGCKVILDYLDTTDGKIALHPHMGKVIEVYMSKDVPYTGEICDIGEYHAPFTDKTIAVKIIYG